MKRTTKKLVLSRETLNGLDHQQDLQQAVGGAVSKTCMEPYSVCEYSGAGRATCLTCQMTCTSNYC